MSDRSRRFHPVLVGAAAGLFCGDLLVGLNPESLGLAPAGRLLLGAALLGALVASPLALLPQRRPPSALAWAVLALLCALLAVFAELQRETYYSFVKNGTRRVLVATALVFGAGALASLAALVKRPGSRAATRLLGGLVLAAALPPLLGRRAVERAGLASPAPLPRTPTRSLLVVGFEGLSWEVVSALASDGTLPTFGRLLAGGAAGPLETLSPYDRAALWTTAATGKRPTKHGVVSGSVFATPLGEMRLLPRFPGASAPRPALLRPREAASVRRSLTFWEIFAARGHQAAVLDWPGAAPPRPGLVLWATERLFTDAPATGAALPEDVGERARLFRVGVANLDHPLARSLAPEGLEPGEAGAALAGAARDLSVVGAALAAVPSGPQNVSAFVLAGAADSAATFLPAAEPAATWGLPVRRAEAKAAALRAYYRFLDETLGDLLAREGQDRTLCLFAPASWGAPPPLTALLRFLEGKEPIASPEAARDGFVVLFGSGIRQGVRLTSAKVLDLAPTLLVLAGEPIARDMDGRVLSEAFDERFAESASVPIVTTFEAAGPQ